MAHQQSLKILVVEDHALFLRLISRMLRHRSDFQIFEATDGLEAVRKIEELQPDLVLLDINLPGLSGFRVAERIPALAPNATFLFVSQDSSPDIVRMALGLGARGYVHKQSVAIDLLRAVEAALAGRRFVSSSLASIEPEPPTAHRHEIRFCADDKAIVEGATRFLAAALEAGDAAIALVTESHRPRVLQGLRTLGVDVHHAIEQGTYLSFDADQALDLVHFREAINRVREAAAGAGKAHPRVAFCGERAGRLWAAGRTAEAVELEQVCGDLAQEVDILCIYPVPHAHDDPALARICAGHTAVFPESRPQGDSMIARDITETRRAEAALRHSEHRLARELAAAKTLQSISGRLISESAADSLYAQIVGAAMELMASDAASVQMLADDQLSLRLLAWRNFHPDSAAFWQVVTLGAGSTCGQALRDNARVLVEDVDACDFMAGTQDHEEYRRSGIRAVQSTPLHSRSGRPLGMLSTHWRTPHAPTDADFRLFDALARQAADLIERTLAEEALSKVNQRLIEAHEEESTRIARELHDDINQRLSCVSMRLDYLKGSAPASAAGFVAELAALSQQTKELGSDIQALSHRLHSSRLDLLGLEAAAAGFCDELSQRQDVRIDARFENIPKPLSRDISLCLYRVLQEALQNVVKHCEPRHARVLLRGQTNAISLTVEDSGCGFEPAEAMNGHGLGLTSMGERLKLVGGQLSVQSQKGTGTTLHAVVPLHA